MIIYIIECITIRWARTSEATPRLRGSSRDSSALMRRQGKQGLQFKILVLHNLVLSKYQISNNKQQCSDLVTIEILTLNLGYSLFTVQLWPQSKLWLGTAFLREVMLSRHGMGVKKAYMYSINISRWHIITKSVTGTANLKRTGYGASFRQNKSSSISNVSVVSNGKMWIRK